MSPGSRAAAAAAFCAVFTLASPDIPIVSDTAENARCGGTKWEAYKRDFRKAYASDAEEQMRCHIFQKTLLRIAFLNVKNGEAVFGLNPTSDRLPEEKHKRGRKGHGDTRFIKTAPVLEVPHPRCPAAIDWRRTRVVTPVKNQGQCGSCWAFSAAEAVESAYALKVGGAYSEEFSPQQIASCTTACAGCGGGDTVTAYEYLKSSPGLASAWFWPYAQGLTPKGSCTGASCTQDCNSHNLDVLKADEFYIGPYANVTGFQYATPPCTTSCRHQNLKKLAEALESGPVSICVNAGVWDDYTAGVLTAKACGAMNELDHCVQLVGYNTTAPKPYWIVRNSWATSWGMEGYIHLEFDANTCGLADEATIPTLDDFARSSKDGAAGRLFLEASTGLGKRRGPAASDPQQDAEVMV